MNTNGIVIDAMIKYYSGDVRRINHFLKVYSFAKAIGEMEGIEKSTQEILEIAALTHDIGIKNSEKKYHSTAGNYQQVEGPPVAKKMLEDLQFDPELIDRVCWLIAHHHTYDNIQGIDYQILVEADFLVNAYEDNLFEDAIIKVREKLFKTASGIKFLNEMFLRELP
jgi:HD superfamily phosphodiesterase